VSEDSVKPDPDPAFFNLRYRAQFASFIIEMLEYWNDGIAGC